MWVWTKNAHVGHIDPYGLFQPTTALVTRRSLLVKVPPPARSWPTPAQLRAARGALGLSLPDVARLTGLGLNTLKRAEQSGLAVVTPANADRIVSTLHGLGVTFLDDDGAGPGLRFKAD